MTYKGIRVKSGNNINVGEPLGIETPSFDLEEGQLYTLQWKHCNKTPHDVLNYIYVGEQSLGSINLTTFKTVDIVENYQEKLCFIEFVCNKTLNGTNAKIGRVQDSKDTPNTECFLIREVQIERGSMSDYKPNHGDDITELEKIQTQINQTSSKVDIMAKKTDLDKIGNKLSSAMASIAVQAGLIENKVEEGKFSTLIRQSPKDVQYAFNGVNPRYVYTNDGFYMKADNGNNKASFKRGSFYCYNYTDGTFLGGLTPFVFKDAGLYNAGQGIINSANSYFFTIGKDLNLSSDTQDFATDLISYFTINFRDRTGSGNAYKYGMQVFTPLYVYDVTDHNNKDVKNIKDLYAITISTSSVWDLQGGRVFDLTPTDAFNYKNWDWGNKNLVNCNWVGTYDTNVQSKISNDDISIIDSVDVIKKDNGKLGLINSSIARNVNYDNADNFDYSQLIYSLVDEVKQLKEEIKKLKAI